MGRKIDGSLTVFSKNHAGGVLNRLQEVPLQQIRYNLCTWMQSVTFGELHGFNHTSAPR